MFNKMFSVVKHEDQSRDDRGTITHQEWILNSFNNTQGIRVRPGSQPGGGRERRGGGGEKGVNQS